MKNKKIKTIISIVILSMIAGVYLIYNSHFPFAKPIECPLNEAVDSIFVSVDNGMEAELNYIDFAQLLLYINNAKPTRTKSVHDYPTVKPFYGVRIETREETYRYMLYEKKGKGYIEIPYAGVYTVDCRAFEIIQNTLKEMGV